MDFIMGFLISTNQKGDSYYSILIIFDWLTKIVYYEPVKVSIDILGLAKKTINIVVYYHGVLELIVTDRGLLFMSKFCDYYLLHLSQQFIDKRLKY